MSLINQALKEEQRRRDVPAAAVNAPMIAMAGRRNNSKGPILLVGFAFMGIVMAAIVTSVFYFGSEFLDDSNLAIRDKNPMSLASGSDQQSDNSNPVASESSSTENPLGTLSSEQLATVQQMLLEKAEQEKAAEAEKIEEPKAYTAEQIRLQEVVDLLSIQGIRKSGQSSRVFMNGRIQKIGDIVDLENGLTLIGFTENELILHDRDGNRYQKRL